MVNASEDSSDECPRCGSENVSSDVRTDIPGDRRHNHGCDDCLFVWD